MLLFNAATLHAINIKIVDARTGDPLPGVLLLYTLSGWASTTDTAGIVTIPDTLILPSPIIISLSGYNTDTLSSQYIPPIISLKEVISLSEVNIVERNGTTSISTIDPINILKIGEGELRKAACCNLSESFETSPAVTVAYRDAVTGAKEIQLLGLSGVYVQQLHEMIPAYRGIAANYGLVFVPGPWMEGIQVTKGNGSVVNGFEGTAGALNIEFKKPIEKKLPELFVNLYAEQNNRSEFNVIYRKELNDKWSTSLFTHGNRMKNQIDFNNDSFYDMPHTRQINLYNRWSYFNGNNLEAQYGIKYVYDIKEAGQLANDPDHNGHHGPNHLFTTQVINNRVEGYAKVGILFPHHPIKSIGNIISLSNHELKATFGLKSYDAIQKNGYYQFIYQGMIGNTNHTFKTGYNLQYETLEGKINEITNDEHTWLTNGVFYEYTYTYLSKWMLIAGLRADYHNQYGFLYSPKVHLRYSITDDVSLKWSGGISNRLPYMVADNLPMLATGRVIVRNEMPAEEIAFNTGLSITTRFKWNGRSGSFVADAYHTSFMNQYLADYFSSPTEVRFYNLNGKSFANSLQFTFDYELLANLDFRLAYKTDDVRATYNGKIIRKPFIANEKALVNLAYGMFNDHFKIDFTVTMEGNKRMTNTTIDPVFGQLPATSPYFYLASTQVTREFRKFDIYAGCVNIGNLRQRNAVISYNNPFGSTFDAMNIWGPLEGRRLYIGIKYNIKKI
ncbi:MAG: hypothetical protein RIQ89_835 [Bacteroidota bacterium]|jgi:outer membrane receptor for ferrienterochelin and colicin